MVDARISQVFRMKRWWTGGHDELIHQAAADQQFE